MSRSAYHLFCNKNEIDLSLRRLLYLVIDVALFLCHAEFQPYVFQILAQMLEVHAVGDISPPYAGLFPFLMQPALWESRGKVPPNNAMLATCPCDSGTRHNHSFRLTILCQPLLYCIALTDLLFGKCVVHSKFFAAGTIASSIFK